ncbi:MAG: hypothetical protein ACFFCS_03370 [Candidatus Hodarchaeota archaeon]
MEDDTIKFFQSFIAQMIEIGGINLPRSIASKLGRNLGDIYKKKGVTDWTIAIKGMFRAMGGESTEFKKADGDTIVTTDYPGPFCSIGGRPKERRFSMFTESICRPYAKGFLSAFRPDFKLEIESIKCVLKGDDNKCQIKVAFSRD